MRLNQRIASISLGFIAVFVIGLVLFFSSLSEADVLTLQEGVNGYEHLGSYLRSGDGFTGAALKNYGGSPQWLVGQHSTTSVGTMRPVLGFSLSDIPAGSTITSVSLTITTDSSAGTGLTGDIELHEIIGSVDMDEGTLNGGQSATEGVMWSRIRAGVPWISRGGDYSPTVLSTVVSFDAVAQINTPKTFASNASFVAAAQAALDSVSIFEMILLSPAAESTPAITNFARIVADDSEVIASRPILTIEYEPPVVDVIMFREGVDGYEHLGAYLREGDGFSGSALYNYGGSVQWLVGLHSTLQGRFRPVLGFDLGDLPTGSNIYDISLTITTDSAAGTGTIGDIQLHEVTGSADMDEGTLDGAGSATEGVTWLRIRPLVSWFNDGGDYSSTVLSTVAGFDATITGSPKTFESTNEFVTAAQTAFDSGSPLEMILVSPTTESGGVTQFARIAADDSEILGNRPVLRVEYGVGPRFCGDDGTVYSIGDINKDCYVDFMDFAELAKNWTQCSDPNITECDQYWK